MKQGTMYAGRIKKAFAKARADSKPVEAPPLDDPLHRLCISIFGVAVGDERGEKYTTRLLTQMVDWNEIRVSTVEEIETAIGTAPQMAKARCRSLLDAMHAVYECENVLSLDRLRDMGRRDARAYLEALEGVDDYAVASVTLWSLGGHAIPVDDRLLEALQVADLVHPLATRGEVQAFLERHISAADAKDFYFVMQTFTPTAKASSSAKKKKATTKGKRKTTKAKT